jgi:predicted helicase
MLVLCIIQVYSNCAYRKSHLAQRLSSAATDLDSGSQVFAATKAIADSNVKITLPEFDCLYRPYAKRWVYFDSIINQRTFQWPKIDGPVVCVTDIASEKPFMASISGGIADLHLVGGGAGAKCFPLSAMEDSAVERFRQHYSSEAITKERVFDYTYALLHHPIYRERYAANLKRELPRIPFASDFHAFAAAGRELSSLHVDYEKLTAWPLEFIENKAVPYSERVTKMKLSPDRQTLQMNDSSRWPAFPLKPSNISRHQRLKTSPRPLFRTAPRHAGRLFQG